MGRRGQVVNRTHSGGLGVGAYWAKLFRENATAHLPDEALTVQMQQAFSLRRSKIFYQVRRVRWRYNRGDLTGGRRPRPVAHRYNGAGFRVTARGAAVS